MAKYTYDYSCGHGTAEVELYGKHDERDRKLQWLSDTRVCPDCYKKSMREQDAAAEQILTINFVGPSDIRFAAQVSGKIEANKDALKALGYSWQDSTTGGVMSLLNMSKPKRMLVKYSPSLDSLEAATAWFAGITEEAAALGYKATDGIGPLDIAMIQKIISGREAQAAAKAEKAAKAAEVQATDPKPATSPLRKRIAELEKSSGSKWNGKFYGGKGHWHFYVNNEKHPASNAEIAERETQLKELAAWQARHPELK